MALRNSWAIASLASAGIFVTFMLRTNISPVAPVLAHDLQLSDFQLGLVLSGFLWVYTFLQPLAGFITDRFGAKASMLAGVMATSVLTIMNGLANSFLSLLALRVLLGATQAPNFVSGAKITSSEWFEKDQRARASSIWIAGGRLGPVIAFPFSAWLAISFGWPWVFYATGLIGLAWCLAWLFGFKDSPTNQNVQTASKLKLKESLPVVLSPLGLGFALASFGQGYVAYYLNLWLPTYLVRQQKFTLLNAGIYSTLPLIAAVITLLIVGGGVSDYLVKRGAHPLGLRRKMFAIGMTLTAAMLFLTAYAPSAYAAITSLSLAGAMLGFSTPSLWTALVEATPQNLTGTMGGMQNFGGNLAGIVVSVLTGYILQVTGSFNLAILAGGLAALLGAASMLVLVRGGA